VKGYVRLWLVCATAVPFVAAVAIGASESAMLAGCKRSSQHGAAFDAGAVTTTAAARLTPEQAQKPIAEVAGDTITLGDFAAALEHMNSFDRLRYGSPERRKELLDEMITVKLLATEAVAKGYDKDPLAQQELRAVLRDAMLAEARKGAPAPADLPENEVRAYFEAHRADYKDPERRRLSLLAAASDAQGREALAAAKKAKTAADWGFVVRAKSIDPAARSSTPIDLAGDVGIVSPPGDPRGENGRVPEEVRVAAFAIAKVGDVADEVIASGGKFYVVRLTQKLAAHERSFEEAERTIRVKLAQEKLRAEEDALLADLRKNVKVEIDEAALATVKVDTNDAGHALDAHAH